jgi:protein SCO1
VLAWKTVSRFALVALFPALFQAGNAQSLAAKDAPAAHPKDAFGYTEYTRNTMRNRFPDVVLLTQNSKQVRFYDDLIKDHTVVIQFMFAHCDNLCPVVTPNLVRAQQELNRRAPGKVTFLSVTVDPTRDTPEVLKDYSSRFRVQPDWYFLTGKKEDVDLIRRRLGVYDTDENKVQHMNVLTIGNEPAARWLAMEALAKPDDIAETVLRVLASPR